MGVRVSIKEAKERGWIDEKTASSLQEKSRSQSRNRSSEAAAIPVCPLEGCDPQSKLWRALLARYPRGAADGDLLWEFKGAVPDRRFRVDIVWRSAAIAIEVDGYQFHGRIKKGFHRDREKDRLMLINGWKTLRYTAKEINQDIDKVLDQIFEIAKKKP